MTNLLKIALIITQTSEECARAFEIGWLLHYPRPMCMIHDLGSEFISSAFQDLLCRAGIKSVPTTAHNPQGNSIIEAVHKSVGHVLCILIHLHNPQTVQQAKAVGDTALAMAIHATCCASHKPIITLQPYTWLIFLSPKYIL